METKVCNKCHQTKAVTEYHKSTANKGGRKPVCKQCASKRKQDWYQGNKDTSDRKARTYAIRRDYGITKETYDILMAQAGTHCKICYNRYTEGNSKFGKTLDHCHTTGNIRGVICQACNKALGKVRDNPETLSNLINYLK